MSRRPAAVLGLLLLLGAAGLAAAPAALADASSSTISCPAATGGTVGSRCTTVTGAAADGTTQLQADVAYTTCADPLCGSVTLTVTATGARAPLRSATLAETTNVTGGSGTIPLTLPADAPDGRYTAALSGDGASASASFTLAVPPSPVVFGTTNVATPGRATVTWAASTPTPATAYALDVDGRPTTVKPACSAGRCTGTVSGLVGGHVFQVVASRPSGTTAAALTTTAITTATVRPAHAGTEPASGGSAGTVVGAPQEGTAPRTVAGTAAGHDAAAAPARHAAGASPRRPAVAVLPALPLLPGATPAAGDGEPTDPGTYGSTLPYAKELTVRTKVAHPTALAHVEDAISDRTLLEALAGALLLALVAAHLRVLARRTTSDL